MKTLIIGLSLVLAACSSSKPSVNITRPTVEIAQTSGVPPAARHVTGGLPVRYAIRVSNLAAEPITLRQISVQSLGEGAYTVASNSRPYNVIVEPNGIQDIEFWASAFVSVATTVGANGPVTLRLNLIFDSPLGKFEEIVVRQVNERAGLGESGSS
ncbi:MAG TPA: hypothetical protein VF701_03820 [Thermoanaerobaculia bacterium]